MPIYPQLQRRADNIRPPASRHHFLAGREKCRTHRGRVLAAAATAVALLEIADEGTVFELERQPRCKRKLKRTLEIVPQMIVDFMSTVAENFSGVKDVFRIKRILDFAHHAQQFVPKLLTHIFRPRDTDAVLG